MFYVLSHPNVFGEKSVCFTFGDSKANNHILPKKIKRTYYRL